MPRARHRLRPALAVLLFARLLHPIEGSLVGSWRCFTHSYLLAGYLITSLTASNTGYSSQFFSCYCRSKRVGTAHTARQTTLQSHQTLHSCWSGGCLSVADMETNHFRTSFQSRRVANFIVLSHCHVIIPICVWNGSRLTDIDADP